MNKLYAFEVTIHGVPGMGLITSSGSEETRARRRLLEALHADGRMVKTLKLVAEKPAPRKGKGG